MRNGFMKQIHYDLPPFFGCLRFTFYGFGTIIFFEQPDTHRSPFVNTPLTPPATGGS